MIIEQSADWALWKIREGAGCGAISAQGYLAAPVIPCDFPEIESMRDRGTPPSRGRDRHRTGPQLRCRKKHNIEAFLEKDFGQQRRSSYAIVVGFCSPDSRCCRGGPKMAK